MKIFMTGASGFIGQRVVDILLEKGHELVCLTHQKSIDRPGITTVQGDLRNKETLTGMEGCDAVIANAAIYIIGAPKPIRKIMPDVNITGTKNTLDKALELGIPKIVYTSTLAVVSDTKACGIATEKDIPRLISQPTSVLYFRTKKEAHTYAQQLIDQKNAPIVIAMPSLVFGENDHTYFGENLKLLVQGKFPGQMDVKNKYNINYVGDVAQGIVLCLEKGAPGPYFIAGPEENNIVLSDFFVKAAELGGLSLPDKRFSLKTLAMVAKMMGIKGAITNKQQPLTMEHVAACAVNFEVSNAKAVQELGYTPRPLDEAIKITIDWYKEHYGKK